MYRSRALRRARSSAGMTAQAWGQEARFPESNGRSLQAHARPEPERNRVQDMFFQVEWNRYFPESDRPEDSGGRTDRPILSVESRYSLLLSHAEAFFAEDHEFQLIPVGDLLYRIRHQRIKSGIGAGSTAVKNDGELCAGRCKGVGKLNILSHPSTAMAVRIDVARSLR